jgi:SAM-dependent methyltransferase
MMSIESLVRRVRRKLTPDTRALQLREEVDFWEQWFETKGLKWPDDYAERFDGDMPLQEHLSIYASRLPADHIKILDVGSGPLTKLGKVHPAKTLSITAVDVLAAEYDRLLKQFNITPLVRTQYGVAEKLQQQFGTETFDIVHAQNSLDHTSEPLMGLREMLAVTKRGGYVVLLHAENEGKNESYKQLHKWDFTCERGHFIIGGPGRRGPRRDITQHLANEAEVECTFHHGNVLVGIKRL